MCSGSTGFCAIVVGAGYAFQLITSILGLIIAGDTFSWATSRLFSIVVNLSTSVTAISSVVALFTCGTIYLVNLFLAIWNFITFDACEIFQDEFITSRTLKTPPSAFILACFASFGTVLGYGEA